jgi:hypothetical protein
VDFSIFSFAFHLYTSIAQSGQIRAQNVHPVQTASFLNSAGFTPRLFSFLDKLMQSLGQYRMQSPQPLHFSLSIFIFAILSIKHSLLQAGLQLLRYARQTIQALLKVLLFCHER